MAVSAEALVGVAKRIFFALLVVYAIACAALYAEQTRFIFFPDREVVTTPAEFGCTSQDVTIPEGSYHLQGWWLPGTNGKTVIYFHGNGGNIGANVEHACRFQKMGFSALLFDYRGYGKSDGDFPTERSVYADADRAWSYLIDKHIAPADIVLYGHSLGGAVAIEIAKRHPDARALVVESTFTSLLEMSERDRLSRVFPLKLLMTEQMDSLAKISSIKMPI